MTDTKFADADGINTFREMREYATGRLDVKHQDVHPIAGLIEDDDVREMLMFMAETYDRSFLAECVAEDSDLSAQDIIDEMPASFWDTKFAREVVRKHATNLATTAVNEGNLTQTAFFSGLPSYRSDVSGLHAIHDLREWLIESEQCKLIYIAALMGRGKTDLSLTFFEIIHDHYARVRSFLRGQDVDDEEIERIAPKPEFASNFEVTPPEHLGVEVHEIRTERELLEWAEGGSSAQVRWFIFDEASTALTAQSGANAQKVAENMAPFVKRMRKLGVNMMVIGHDRGDVHVAIRSLADFVDKPSLKSATFYAGIEGREPVNELFSIDGVPPTSWEFNTDDMADWEWMEDDEEVEDEFGGWDEKELKREIEERGCRLWRSTDLNQTEVAEYLSNDVIRITSTGISRAQERLDAEEARSGATAKAA